MAFEAKLIRTEDDYAAAMTELGALWDAKPEPGTPAFDRLELLGLLVETYDLERSPMLPPDPVEAIRFYMEQNGMRPKDLGEVVHSRARASDILNGNRGLSLEQIRAIHAAWRIPYEALIA